MITTLQDDILQALRDEYPTLKAVNERIERLKIFRQHHQEMAAWGNVESKERLKKIRRLEKNLNQIKKEYKENGKNC